MSQRPTSHPLSYAANVIWKTDKVKKTSRDTFIALSILAERTDF